MSEVTVYGVKAGSGEHVYHPIPVTRMANGTMMCVPLHIVNGMRPGPKIMLSALSHGDATTGLEISRQVLESVDVHELCGTIVAVPCQNPVAFEWDSRNTPIDDYNMNRTYPGNARGWFTEQLSAAISPLCDEVDMLIDWHGGGYGSAINYILLRLGSHEGGDETEKLGLAYGLEYLYNGKPAGPAAAYAGSLTDYMLTLGKNAIVAEIGSGMELAFDIVASGVRGVFNVMKHMGMLPGTPILPSRQYIIRDRPLVRPKNGGMFYPECGAEYLNRTVPKGTLVATIRCPLTFDIIESIYAPCEETVFLDMRGVMAKVHPGDYAYIFGDRSTARVIEND